MFLVGGFLVIDPTRRFNNSSVFVILNMVSVTNADKTLRLCKKCGECHEKPINNKCEWSKTFKDEKRDTSRDSSAKKTPRGKSSSEVSQGDKVLDLC